MAEGARQREVAACRGVRGAITIDGPEDLDRAVGELLSAMLERNAVEIEEVAALIFTIQDDLGRLNPAASARERGFARVPLLMVREHGGDTRVAGCLRALMLVNSTLPQGQISHQYLRNAAGLRPDLVQGAGAKA